MAPIFYRVPQLLCWAIAVATLTGCAPRPAIVNGIITDKDWYHWDGATRKFSARLQQKFQPGSDETTMIRALQEQGFQYPPAAKPGCIPPKDIASMRVGGPSWVPCPPYDPKHHLTWGRPTMGKTSEMVGAVTPRPGGLSFCREGLDVDWTTKDGKITSIKGDYGGYCNGGF